MKKKEGCQAQGFSCERKIKEKPFYMTARVKKEGVQALSLFFSQLSPCPYEKSEDF